MNVPAGRRYVPRSRKQRAAGPARDRRGWTGSAVADAAAFLVGGWLLVAPFALHYPTLASGFPGRWNDILVGGAVAAQAASRQLRRRVAGVPWSRLLFGVWLTVAPLVLGYPATALSAAPVVNDMALGAALIALAAAVDGHRAGDGRHVRDGPADGTDPQRPAGTGATGP